MNSEKFINVDGVLMPWRWEVRCCGEKTANEILGESNEWEPFSGSTSRVYHMGSWDFSASIFLRRKITYTPRHCGECGTTKYHYNKGHIIGIYCDYANVDPAFLEHYIHMKTMPKECTRWMDKQ